MKRWEYLVLERGGEDIEPELDRFGKEGWELVATLPWNEIHDPRMILKRPLPATRKPSRKAGE